MKQRHAAYRQTHTVNLTLETFVDKVHVIVTIECIQLPIEKEGEMEGGRDGGSVV